MKQSSVPSRAEVMAACRLSGPMYGINVTEAEAILQQFVSENTDHNIMYTPKVYDSFTEQRINALPVIYIVIERVYGEVLAAEEDDIALENIAATIHYLISRSFHYYHKHPWAISRVEILRLILLKL
ncbi:hypothetical protein H112_00381 [Trichophyton rubrum D6]|uniref:Uncharacterized protein n=2 Tax=Trichophyton TaxID=5550 RepID=A0A022WG46_TRIRU|nr:hypothetical protein H100_00382 [Trichophyton rubrum MR850]EZF46687.1 hypothetical protein H102_00381 [Trichophyton rubrum CBS 100081]EZF57352.1 hypothetical protein H103_00380 [Trichophyton rubrum CBS 288.86]EZF67929.1 hypothetical protein H104_00381 [Trichophyton rubrum CBS 289.86]EZF78662.1 hypothetical protein H105_00376 [Trichophyton soudanense CBS 452.61]EZF89287.1 hypothetical protein H110_00384 [Trichophyton rubrum MR1448]EZG00062.1 hypothetical protein H113_00384 [Trichophyton rub